jgi:uncharacterized protein YdeI (YjbR/CyaY-like superfamily)
MPKRDPRIDTYIARAADFAKPVLNRIRRLVHAACPQVEETIKWNSPFYLYKGILLATPAFKQHGAFFFWKGKLLFSDYPAKNNPRGKLRHITSITDLPADKILTGYIKQAVKLNEAGIKIPRPRPKAKKEVVVPDYFLAALRKNKKALAVFGNFSPGHKREYVQWITGAKREETRVRRIRTAIQWLAKGKSRNWEHK